MLDIAGFRLFQWTQKKNTAQLIRQASGASVTTYLRKGEKYCTAIDRGERKNVREALQTPRSVKKDLGEVLQVPEQFPL